MPKVCVIGGVCADITGFPHAGIIERDSNPSAITLRAGGVGFNIARSLALLGNDVRMVCALGRDAFAKALEDEAQRAGVRLLPIAAERSGVYLCINDENGDMRFAFSDLAGTEAHITPDTLAGFLSDINACDACVVDGNLTESALACISANVTAPIFADPVSTKKAMRFLPFLKRLHAVKPNIYEARAMTGLYEPADCAEALVKAGCRYAFVSCGESGMVFSGPDGSGFAAAEPSEGCTTGAGDAACAMLIHALLTGSSAMEAARLANRFAAEAILGNDRTAR